MISPERISEIRTLLDTSKNPVFLFDDDPDGVCAFTLLYKYKQAGHGIVVKNAKVIPHEMYAQKVNQYEPDAIFILDKPGVEAAFVDEFTCPIIIIDHHVIEEDKIPKRAHVHYFNPLEDSEGEEPTTMQCWKVVEPQQKKQEYDNLWIAIVGCIGDWYFPKRLAAKFSEKYPKILPDAITTAPDALFQSDVGKLARVIWFGLKGKTSEAMKVVKIFTRIIDPKEILRQTSAQGKYLLKKHNTMRKGYDALKDHVQSFVDESEFIVAIMPDQKTSFSSELSNEILWMYPKKVIILARSSDGSYKCSLRTGRKSLDLTTALATALKGLDGTGGGHMQACGAKIRDDQFEEFIEKFKLEIGTQLKK